MNKKRGLVIIMISMILINIKLTYSIETPKIIGLSTHFPEEKRQEIFISESEFYKYKTRSYEVGLPAGSYSKVIEKVDSDSGNWWHRQCYEKNAKFSLLDTNPVCGEDEHDCTIDEIGFDWNTKTAFVSG